MLFRGEIWKKKFFEKNQGKNCPQGAGTLKYLTISTAFESLVSKIFLQAENS